MSNPARPGIRENFVYWLFDKDDECLYVGMTRRPERRWAQHRRERPDMFARVAYRRMAGPFELTVARQFEREQQEDLQPVFDVWQSRMRHRHLSIPHAPTNWVWAKKATK